MQWNTYSEHFIGLLQDRLIHSILQIILMVFWVSLTLFHFLTVRYGQRLELIANRLLKSALFVTCWNTKIGDLFFGKTNRLSGSRFLSPFLVRFWDRLVSGMEVSRTGLGLEAGLSLEAGVETYVDGLGLSCPCLGGPGKGWRSRGPASVSSLET